MCFYILLHVGCNMENEKIISVRPIGVVKNNVQQPRFGGFAGEVSEIVLDEKFASALDGIEEYSHIIVVYWMDKVSEAVMHHRPQGTGPEVGIFACRCPARPNPIAFSTVPLLSRSGNTLRVRSLDAINGSPVIDIKPYWPQYDFVEKGNVPDWVNKLKF